MSIRIKLQQIIEKHTSKHKILRFGPTFFAFMVLTLFFVVSPQLAAQLCQSAQSLHTQSIGPAQKNSSWLGFLGFLSKQQWVTQVTYVKDSLTRNRWDLRRMTGITRTLDTSTASIILAKHRHCQGCRHVSLWDQDIEHPHLPWSSAILMCSCQVHNCMRAAHVADTNGQSACILYSDDFWWFLMYSVLFE